MLWWCIDMRLEAARIGGYQMCQIAAKRPFDRLWPSQIRKVASLSAQALREAGHSLPSKGGGAHGRERAARRSEYAPAVELSGLRQLLRSRARRSDLQDAAHRRRRPRLPGARSVLQSPWRLR